ncbi:MAG TPA: exopolysaccharide biosynthesis polyprenyl glycosylphosphotransferase [Candidatus Dormibacteraeota bacterium]|nr:exopolysaccharide biosynthesis polyprenyl glycosylphosphotransferase [Candidatus Dormibacteraeota bacterium]
MIEAQAQAAAGAAVRRHGVPVLERRLVLAGLDCVGVALAFVLAFNIRTAPARDAGFYVPRLGTAIAVGTWLLCAQVSGAFDLRATRRLVDILRVTGTTLALSLIVLLGIFFVVPYKITRPTLLLWVPLAAAGVFAGRVAYRRVFAGSQFASRITLVAGDDVLERVWPELRPHIGGIYHVAAIVDPAAADADTRLVGSIERRHVDQIVLGVRDNISNELFRGVLASHERGVSVRSLADLYEELTGRLLLDQLGRNWLMSLPMRGETSPLYRAFKRAVDIGAALAALAVLAVVLPFVFLASLVTGRGPLFHSQVRVGKYGREFRLSKLRTMRVRADGDTSWTRRGDDRVTPVGRVLRPLHLDELPQAWSILRGEMSLIGPRPEQPQYVETLSKEIDFYSTRLTVRPGLTGWAQVNYGYGSGTEGARVKLSYDLYYIKRQSAALDSLIVARTLLAVLSLNGR